VIRLGSNLCDVVVVVVVVVVVFVKKW